MMQISTTQHQGPSSHAIDFIRQFARSYKPQNIASECKIVLYDAPKTLGEC